MPNHVIVGGGAVGLELATGLGNTLARRKRARITLVNKAHAHLWNPRFYIPWRRAVSISTSMRLITLPKRIGIILAIALER
jgi:NADH dehydrogenase FAD-containing subunit